MILDRLCEREQIGVPVLAEIRRLEQFRQQDNLRAARGRCAHHPFRPLDIAGDLGTAGELGGGDGDRIAFVLAAGMDILSASPIHSG
jgi:hypothetical protein